MSLTGRARDGVTKRMIADGVWEPLAVIFGYADYPAGSTLPVAAVVAPKEASRIIDETIDPNLNSLWQVSHRMQDPEGAARARTESLATRLFGMSAGDLLARCYGAPAALLWDPAWGQLPTPPVPREALAAGPDSGATRLYLPRGDDGVVYAVSDSVRSAALPEATPNVKWAHMGPPTPYCMSVAVDRWVLTFSERLVDPNTGEEADYTYMDPADDQELSQTLRPVRHLSVWGALDGDIAVGVPAGVVERAAALLRNRISSWGAEVPFWVPEVDAAQLEAARTARTSAHATNTAAGQIEAMVEVVTVGSDPDTLEFLREGLGLPKPATAPDPWYNVVAVDDWTFLFVEGHEEDGEPDLVFAWPPEGADGVDQVPAAKLIQAVGIFRERLRSWGEEPWPAVGDRRRYVVDEPEPESGANVVWLLGAGTAQFLDRGNSYEMRVWAAQDRRGAPFAPKYHVNLLRAAFRERLLERGEVLWF